MANDVTTETELRQKIDLLISSIESKAQERRLKREQLLSLMKSEREERRAQEISTAILDEIREGRRAATAKAIIDILDKIRKEEI